MIQNTTGKPWDKVSMRDRFELAWSQCGFDGSDLTPEYVFDADRAWRFDLASPLTKVAIEFDGMGFGHQSMKGRIQDNEKQNAAIAQGWRVLRFTKSMMPISRMAEVVDLVQQAMVLGVE